MNIWHDLDESRIAPENFIACIEISKGSKNKYEVDKDTGMLRLDRILYTSTHYPANYGFIPRTYADDGDPLDVLVLCSEPLVPLSLVQCYPIGHITMIDDGAEDIKVIAVPFKEPNMNCYEGYILVEVHIRLLERHGDYFTVLGPAVNHGDTLYRVGLQQRNRHKRVTQQHEHIGPPVR